MANISCILLKGQSSSAVSNNYTEMSLLMREGLDNLLGATTFDYDRKLRRVGYGMKNSAFCSFYNSPSFKKKIRQLF